MKAFILLSFLFSFLVHAQELKYLNAEDINLDHFPSPPALNSSEDILDFESVLKIQESRTEEECSRANFEDAGFATSFFGPPYGPLETNEAEKLVEFQETLFKEINFFSRILKTRFKRPRPFMRDQRVTPCVSHQASDSYPSGHAVIAYVASEAFSLLFPERASLLKERSLVIAADRVLGGVHHPKDIEAGRILGKIIFENLLKSEKFIKDLKGLQP